ncbi:MAG: hypothetical protein NVSMB9_08700 [Isosphaeraceae bacterium]
MIRPLVARDAMAGWLTLAVILLGWVSETFSAPPSQTPVSIPGQFLTVLEPITTETIAKVQAGARQFIEQHARRGVRPVLVFEFQAGETAAGTTEFGAAYDLAKLISTRLEGAVTVAYIPRPLQGHAVLAALACDEVAMGSESSLGPITPEGQETDRALREPVRILAVRKGRDPDLLLGMLDRDASLHSVRTANKQRHYVLEQNLESFRKTHEVVEDVPAWEGGRRGVLFAARAREQGFSQLTADSPVEVARHYNLAGQSAAGDPTLGQVVKPVWINIQGPIDTVKKSYLSRRIAQARKEQANLVFFQINSMGGIDTAADAVSDMISEIKDMKTVAFIDDRALGFAALAALSCRDIVFRKGALMGDVHQIVTDRGGGVEELDTRQIQSLTRRVANIAEKHGHPSAIARAMVDPASVILQATDSKTGASCFVLKSQADAEPGRYLNPEVRKEAGQVLSLTADEAASYGLGQVVNEVEDFKALYGLRGKEIRIDGPTWVDSLVTVLTNPLVSWLLLFVGLFMLVLELKLPGIGLPAITSSLAFMLFFWSHYLGGTADQLEIVLFIIGMLCLALELFIFPGFGIFGMSGVLLVLASIVMASHSFLWPTHEYEYRAMGYTLIQLTLAMLAVGVGAVLVARYLPSLPLFNRLVLKAEPWTVVIDPDLHPSQRTEGYDSLAYLVGETGRTTTVLRPSGKARFGDALIDVTADGFFMEPDSLVEVVDVQGSRVIVKRLGT